MLRRLLLLFVVTAVASLTTACNMMPLIFNQRGTLELRVEYVGAEPGEEPTAITIDERFHGHLKDRTVFLNLFEGAHVITVSCPGFVPSTNTVFVARQPNEPVLYVRLVKAEPIPEPTEPPTPADGAPEAPAEPED